MAATNRARFSTSDLVLAIDDFAIKKGHTYNTLRGETMLDLLVGRKLEDLRIYVCKHPEFLALNPKAVVMGLARAYHTWISECFPNAIRIADRFHVHGYVIESVQEVRKSVQSTLSPRAKAILKSRQRLLNPPVDSLSEKSKAQVEILLALSRCYARVGNGRKFFLSATTVQRMSISPVWVLPNG